MQQAEQELKQVQQQYKTYEKQDGDLKEKIVDIKHDIQKFDNIIKENHSKQNHWNSEVIIHIKIFW